MAQSPTIAIPKKSTDEVDWTGPIRAIIKASYGENPDNYATECAALQRCRQDAVRGAGSDLTAASLLTKYFGQLELLELRFSEIRVSFPWRDAFTSKLTTQTSIAFEKASIIYQIAATHSIIASAQNRSDPEGLKRAYYYFRTCAGMLTYINDNFLHAPSTDLSREVVKFLVGIMMAQANETFYETCVDQRKSPALIAKIASHTTFLYNGLCEEVKEFFGKGIFDRNWVTLLQIKAKYFTSLMQYQRSLADTAAGKHGEALARMGVAESNAKEAHKLSSSFAPYFVNTLSTTLPADTGTAILELTKNHLALCTEKYGQGQKDNDLIYNDHVPSEATLSPVDKVSAVTPVPIHEVYGTPEVQKTIGPDLFAKLIPLSVHEAASVYSEEKAKIVRAEVEKAEVAEGEVKASVESLGVKAALGRYKEIAEGEVDESVPATVLSWHEEIQRKQGVDGLEKQLKELEKLKETVARELDAISESLAVESRECEMMRVKFGHRWTQEPSGGPVKDLRRDLKDHRSSLEAAAPSDQQIYTLWDSIRADLALLVSKPKLEAMFASAATGGNAAGDLLDVSEGDTDDADREKMKKLVREIEERLGRLNKISRERNEILKDLKEKVQNDDVSHVLLLNRRNAGVEPSLFATELEKFRPYQSRLAATTHAQQTTIQEIAHMWKSLKDKGGKNKGAKKWEERERRVMA
ncbi:bck1-like resistance to osmotic shock, partial [Serendipita sp. 401]